MCYISSISIENAIMKEKNELYEAIHKCQLYKNSKEKTYVSMVLVYASRVRIQTTV